MPYTINDKTIYSHSRETVRAAIFAAVKGLEGKIDTKPDIENFITIRFDKKILGKVLGERTCIEISLDGSSASETALSLTAYPLDAIGNKLLFGARKGVSQTVVNWFYAHLEHNLKF
jgi:hypothetical protein